jgi:hypothetical protein
MTTTENLLAEVDLLREELDGLYREKQRVEGMIGMLLAGAKELEGQVEDIQQSRLEMLLCMRRVNDIYGPFKEFEPWLKEQTVRRTKSASVL